MGDINITEYKCHGWKFLVLTLYSLSLVVYIYSFLNRPRFRDFFPLYVVGSFHSKKVVLNKYFEKLQRSILSEIVTVALVLPSLHEKFPRASFSLLKI